MKHAKRPLGAWRTLAYFFLLPNITFPLFPVVDFATFRRTWYDRDAFVIYQEGIQWTARGLTHLAALIDREDVTAATALGPVLDHLIHRAGRQQIAPPALVPGLGTLAATRAILAPSWPRRPRRIGARRQRGVARALGQLAL